jgi:hypothetical protein
MNKTSIVLFLALSILSVTVSATPQLLYHQNDDAKSISGSITALTAAIRQGKRIRIYMNLGFVEHAMDAGFLSIIGDNVYAQISDIQAQRPDRKNQTIELKPYSRHVGFYSTQSPYEIKWYSTD